MGYTDDEFKATRCLSEAVRDLDATGELSPAWTAAWLGAAPCFANDSTSPQDVIEHAWRRAHDAATMVQLLLLLEPVAGWAACRSLDLFGNLPNGEALDRENAASVRAHPAPVLPYTALARRLCPKCYGFGAYPTDCGAGVGCWDCASACRHCFEIGTVLRTATVFALYGGAASCPT